MKNENKFKINSLLKILVIVLIFVTIIVLCMDLFRYLFANHSDAINIAGENFLNSIPDVVKFFGIAIVISGILWLQDGIVYTRYKRDHPDLTDDQKIIYEKKIAELTIKMNQLKSALQTKVEDHALLIENNKSLKKAVTTYGKVRSKSFVHIIQTLENLSSYEYEINK